MRNRPQFLILLALLAACSILIALFSGTISIGIGDVWQALVADPHQQSEQIRLYSQILHELRLPRALAAFVTGAMLALAGAFMQVLLRNPLADPYILGISGGAAVAALLCMLLGLGLAFVPGCAFVGALVSMLLVFGLSHGAGAWTSTRLLLTGVIVAAGWGALISLLLALGPESQLRGMLFWLMGDLSHSELPTWPWLVLALACGFGFAVARSLNLLAHGELQASALGVSVYRLRLGIYVIASLLTASAVTLAGSVGFVGLIVPHMMRLVCGSDHRILLLASVLMGGSLLVLSDTLARTLIAPQQLPVGVITALLGVPLFLFLLRQSAKAY